MEADVEALLVNRLGAGRGFPMNQYFLLPVDQCSSWWDWSARTGAALRRTGVAAPNNTSPP